MAEGLRRFRLRVRPGLEDELLALLGEEGFPDAYGRRDYPHGLLADEPDLSPREAELILTVPAAEEGRLRDLLGRLEAAAPGDPALHLDPMPDPGPQDDPDRLWQAQWKPFRCAGFVIHAEFVSKAELPLRAGDLPLTLVAGSAFGTGGHPTTRMALRAVRQIWEERRPDRWLDVGTGSGILAVAAARLGAGQVYALDPEAPSPPQALRMAALNGLAGRVHAWRGGLDSARGVFPAVVANLFADLLQDAAPELAGLLAPGGRLYAGGIVDRRAEATASRLRAAGLRPLAAQARGRWRGGVWERPGRAG